MVRLLVILIALSLASALAAEADPVAKWLDELGSDVFETREAAETALKAYVSANHLKAMEMGQRLYQHWEKAEPEVSKRLGSILDRLAGVDRVLGLDDADLIPDMHGESARLGEIPLLLVVVSSYQMLKFYRATVQTNVSHWHDPELDFKEEWLVSLHVTLEKERIIHRAIKRGETPGASLAQTSCLRDFKTNATVMTIGVGATPEGYPSCPKIWTEYRLNVSDLPLLIKIWDDVAQSGLDVLYKPQVVNWSDFQAPLKQNNIWALRALAEKCDATVPAASRHELLEKGHVLDMLLPYVLFTHLAEKYPDLFKQDYEYWKDKAPDSAVVGRLFRAALEEGKKIVERKEKGKE